MRLNHKIIIIHFMFHHIKNHVVSCKINSVFSFSKLFVGIFSLFIQSLHHWIQCLIRIVRASLILFNFQMMNVLMPAIRVVHVILHLNAKNLEDYQVALVPKDLVHVVLVNFTKIIFTKIILIISNLFNDCFVNYSSFKIMP